MPQPVQGPAGPEDPGGPSPGSPHPEHGPDADGVPGPPEEPPPTEQEDGRDGPTALPGAVTTVWSSILATAHHRLRNRGRHARPENPVLEHPVPDC